MSPQAPRWARRVSLGLLCVPMGRWAGAHCPSWGRLTSHPAWQHPQGHIPRDIPLMATLGRVWAHTDAKGANLLGPGSPRAGRGTVYVPGQPCPSPWWCHPPSAGTAAQASPECCHISLVTPTLGTATGWQRKEDARHRQQDPGAQLPSSHLGYRQPRSRTPTTQGPQRKGSLSPPAAGEHCLQMRENPAHPLPRQLRTPSLTPRLDSPMGGFPRAPGSHHALSPGLTAPASLWDKLPVTAGAPPAGTMPWAMPVSTSGA